MNRLVIARSARIARTWLVSLALVAPFAGCQAVAGIDELHYDADAGDTAKDAGPQGPSSAECKAFCSDVTDLCKGELQAFVSEDACNAVCAHWTPGDLKLANPPDGNTFACRKHQVSLAKKLGGDDTATYCHAAGIGGAGRCGSTCADYCQLFDQVCGQPLGDMLALPTDCESQCAGLRDDGKVSTVDADTLQCRMYHLSNSAVGDPETHCGHAQISHPTSHCYDPKDAETDCDHYCDVVMAICQDDVAVYESRDQCVATCKLLDPGVYGEQNAAPKVAQNTDTVGCRLWHAYSAGLAPKDHCPHAGPTGDGHCGTDSVAPNCKPYCRILEHTCPTSFDDRFENGAECEQRCAKITGAAPNQGYTVKTAATAKGKLQCQMLNAVRAAEHVDDAALCEAAFGDGTCK